MKLIWIAAAALCLSCRLSCFAPAAQVIEAPIADKLRAPGGDAARPFDHAAFDELLRRHVRASQGRVDYAGLAADRGALDEYLAALAAADVAHLSTDERKALLINAYNAFTLALILEHYPEVTSIKELPSPWKTRRWRLAGDVLSLDDIEHGLLRPLYKDPRIHFAVNCASIGCPPLAATAYTGARLDTQLDATTGETLRNPRYARVDGSTLQLTAIMNWYGDDFVAPDASPRADTLAGFVAMYREDVPTGAAVDFLAYDWRLNDVTR